MPSVKSAKSSASKSVKKTSESTLFSHSMQKLTSLIMATFITKNRCYYDKDKNMQQNIICKFFFIITAILVPIALYNRHTYILNSINIAKKMRGEEDDYGMPIWSLYEVIAATFINLILFIYVFVDLYILYVIMKECSCANVYLTFWKPPFWKYLGFCLFGMVLLYGLMLVFFMHYSKDLILGWHNQFEQMYIAEQYEDERPKTPGQYAKDAAWDFITNR